MALKTTLLAIGFLALQLSRPVCCAVGDDCTPEGNKCAATEKCVSNKCAARTACDVAADCSSKGTCKPDHSCTCNAGYTGNDCSTDDPCKDKPCGDNGDCSYDMTVAAPESVCTCKNGFGGTTCTDGPECTTSEDCKDATKPECKKEDGKQSVCAEESNGGNSVAATPGVLLGILLAAIFLLESCLFCQ